MRTARGTEAYRAFLASKAGAVGLCEYDGAAVVMEEQRGRAGVGNGDGGAVRCYGCCGWAKEEAESEMRARGWSGRVRGML